MRINTNGETRESPSQRTSTPDMHSKNILKKILVTEQGQKKTTQQLGPSEILSLSPQIQSIFGRCTSCTTLWNPTVLDFYNFHRNRSFPSLPPTGRLSLPPASCTPRHLLLPMLDSGRHQRPTHVPKQQLGQFVAT